MSDFKVTTNNHSRDVILWDQLTADEQKDFDYPEAAENSYFRFRGDVWSMGDFMAVSIDSTTATSAQLKDWDGVFGQSYFDAIVIRYAKDWSGQTDYEGVVVGHATW